MICIYIYICVCVCVCVCVLSMLTIGLVAFSLVFEYNLLDNYILI